MAGKKKANQEKKKRKTGEDTEVTLKEKKGRKQWKEKKREKQGKRQDKAS